MAAIAPPGRRAAWFAAHGLSWGVALTIGPPVAGAVLGAAGGRAFWWGCAVVVIIAGAALSVAARGLGLPTRHP